jgi:drug/metabolite transporter (DMT)-like permease
MSTARAGFPALFVLLWSTGFIAAKYGLPYAPPLSFLLVRFSLVAALMAIVAWATRAAWPRTSRDIGHLAMAAFLVHGAYLGGGFLAIAHGMAAGTSAMLVGLQPILTVLIARGWLGERVVPRQWTGLVLGLVGVYFVVRHKVDFGGDLEGLLPIGVALVAISVGTMYQKRFCSHVDMRAGAVIQFSVALVYLPLVLLADERAIGGRHSSCSRSAGRSSCSRLARSVCSIGCCVTARRPMSRACSIWCRRSLPSWRTSFSASGSTRSRWPAWC